MAVSPLVRKISEVVKKLKGATTFLSSLFKSPDEYMLPTNRVYFDVLTGKEEYAVNVTRHGGGRGNKANVYSTKEYECLNYDEFTYLTAENIEKRMFGVSPDDSSQIENAMGALMLDRIQVQINKILRAIEIQCRDVLFLGKITLANGDVIDFNQKVSHQFEVGTAWTSTSSAPLTDLGIAGGLSRKDGLSTITDAIFGSDILQIFLDNPQVVTAGNMRRFDRADVSSPLATQTGANYHGTITAADYKLNIWSYPQFVDVPVGFGFPNEGTKVPYIPVDLVSVYSMNADLRLYYGAIPGINNEISPELASGTGLNGVPALIKARMHPYYILDRIMRSIRVGVQSCPIALPGNIDDITVIKQP